MSSTKKKVQIRQQIENNLSDAIELGEAVAEYREQTDHNGGNHAASFGALKHAERKIKTDHADRRLQFIYERYGLRSEMFIGELHDYLHLKSQTWFSTNPSLSQHRHDFANDLFLKMIDPDNASKVKASIYLFKGINKAGSKVPIFHFVNSVISTFLKEQGRKQTDHDFMHFRLIDDDDPSSPVGDTRVGQIDDQLRIEADMPPTPKWELEQKASTASPATLASFGPKGQQFCNDFMQLSNLHSLVVSAIRKDAFASAPDIVETLKPLEIEVWKVQRIKKQFFDGLLRLAEHEMTTLEQTKQAALENVGLSYTKPDLSDPTVLASQFYKSLGARSGKRRKRFKVETKKSRLKNLKRKSMGIEV